MVGVFHKTDEIVYMDRGKKWPFRVYEWSPDRAGKRQPLRIRFIAWEDQTPRRFYIEPVLNQWFHNEDSDFLDKACEAGCKILGKLEKHTVREQQRYRLFAALFRNRDRGHGAIGRQFNYPLDYLNASKSNLITPGLEASLAPSLLEKLSPRQKANLLLHEALKECGKTNERNQLKLIDVIEFYSLPIMARALHEQSRTKENGCFRIDTLPGRSTFDLFFTGGLERSSLWNRSEER